MGQAGGGIGGDLDPAGFVIGIGGDFIRGGLLREAVQRIVLVRDGLRASVQAAGQQRWAGNAQRPDGWRKEGG